MIFSKSLVRPFMMFQVLSLINVIVGFFIMMNLDFKWLPAVPALFILKMMIIKLAGFHLAHLIGPPAKKLKKRLMVKATELSLLSPH